MIRETYPFDLANVRPTFEVLSDFEETVAVVEVQEIQSSVGSILTF